MSLFANAESPTATDLEREETEYLLFQELESAFPRQAFLSVQAICEFLGCEMQVVYNWNKRADRSKRPPVLQVGKQLRFNKRSFARWLASEQSR